MGPLSPCLACAAQTLSPRVPQVRICATGENQAQGSVELCGPEYAGCIQRGGLGAVPIRSWPLQGGALDLEALPGGGVSPHPQGRAGLCPCRPFSFSLFRCPHSPGGKGHRDLPPPLAQGRTGPSHPDQSLPAPGVGRIGGKRDFTGSGPVGLGCVCVEGEGLRIPPHPVSPAHTTTEEQRQARRALCEPA